MNKQVKKTFLIVNVALASTLLLSACSSKEKKEDAKNNKTNYIEKNKTYTKDKTTEVLIDTPSIKKEDILKIIKHGDHWHVFTKDGREHITYNDPNKITETGLSLVSVVSLNQLRAMNVTAIKIHGDHWHVYTADGREFLTYEDPSYLFSHINVEQYIGSHAIYSNPVAYINNPINNDNSSEDNVIKILLHGDHYHIYTASGKEFITYNDPRSYYPYAEYGIYYGGHADNNTKPESEIKHGHKKNHRGIISVIKKEDFKKLKIKEILKHEDHYHIYTEDNNEYITYDNPKEILPDIKIGDYESNNSQNNENITWPEGVTRIVDHKDHWHLYIGDKEVGVVRTNPKSYYPNAEYIDEKPSNNSNIKIEDEELFSYEDIKAEIKDGIVNYISENLKAMQAFGNLHTTLPIYGSNGESNNIFYWLHGNHYHAVTIKQIIQDAKAGEFGHFTAKDVVAALKYKIENPGTNFEVEIEDNITADQKLKFLKDYYKIKSNSDIMRIKHEFYIYLNNKTIKIFLSDLKIEDGKVIPLIELPKIDNENKNSIEENKPTANNNLKENRKEDEITKNQKENFNREIHKSEEIIKNNYDDNSEELFEKYAKMYNMTKEDFEEKFFSLPGVRLEEAEFQNDGSIIYNGKIYNIYTGKEK